jgi:acetyl-CoA C-acetyltransferase
MTEAVIVSYARSPIGRAGKGSLAGVRADDLARQVARSALGAVPALDPREIEDLMLGCAVASGETGSNLARILAVQLGFDEIPGTTVNRFCSSSMQAARMAFHAIRAGEGDAFLTVGVESVSRMKPAAPEDARAAKHPMFGDAVARTGRQAAEDSPWEDPRGHDELPDVYLAMGQTAENVARAFDVSRQEMDEFALRSQQRAEAAADSGFCADEITPIETADGQLVTADDGPRRGATIEALAALKPVFRATGRVTAGNACPLNDGASALVITSDLKARELGLTPLARIVSTAVTGLSPEIMGMGPVEASRRAMDRAKVTIDDVDLVEINEAFAAQVIPSARQLGIDADKLNVNGGAIAIGHPFGMTGARLIGTLVHSLKARDKQVGLASLCVGGGQGMAVIVERLS